MLKNYVTIALRNLMNNKLYSLINIGGLAIGMAIFIFATILSNYEKTHDAFFKDSDRIYTLGSVISPNANFSVKEFETVYSALPPLLEAEIPEIEATARIIQDEYLLTFGDKKFYQQIKFVDKAFLDIFDFEYIAGDNSALNDPTSIILTESMAKRYFPDGDAMGKIISLSFHEKVDVRVTAVIRDLPRNSHFVSSLIDDNPLEILVSVQALVKMNEFKMTGDWDNISTGNLTYVRLPSHLDNDWLTRQADAVYQRHASPDTKDFIESVKSRRLLDMNLVLWEMVGWRAVEFINVLGLLILIIAGMNYTNLATAQALGRAKEVGLRKTMGANINQLLSQFLVESIATAALAMLAALALLEILVPVFNNALGKVLDLNYFQSLPLLLGVTLLVGILAGSYPAYVITRTSPIDALKNTLTKGAKGAQFRNIMIGAQFVFSIFMLAMVAVVFFQNKKIISGSEIFPKSQIVVLDKTWVGDIPERRDVLKQEISKVPGVERVTYSSQVPFVQQNWTFTAAKNSGDEAGKVRLNRIHVEYDFIKTYDIPLMMGRDFSRDMAQDIDSRDSEVVNVIVNEMALKKLGFSSPEAALNKSFYRIYKNSEKKKEFRVVGIMADQNFLGLHNNIKPIVFSVFPRFYEMASVRIKGEHFSQAMATIEGVWDNINPNHPMQVYYLDAYFDGEFKIFRAVNIIIFGFALTALSLAFIGLFGLAAFMATGRTKEIGIRKVMGAESYQIVMLLIWQFSRPVMWALVFALPLSYYFSGIYLEFFAERIEFPMILVAGAGLFAVILSWMIILGHAVRVSRRKPIYALRYE